MTDGPEREFEFYECMLDGKRAFITVDLKLRESAPQRERSLLARITIPLLQPRDNGLPSREESPKIYDMEDALDEALREKFGAVLAGKYFGGGVRRLYFYLVSEEGLEQAVDAVWSRARPHVWTVDLMKDPRWEVYLEMLYPNALGMQYIQDRRLLDTLQKEGDPLTEPREVTHWIYFPDEEARSRFLAQVVADGFEVRDQDTLDEGERPWKLVLARVDRVDLGSITPITERLWVMADRLGGEYDGWECEVKKPEPGSPMDH